MEKEGFETFFFALGIEICTMVLARLCSSNASDAEQRVVAPRSVAAIAADVKVEKENVACWEEDLEAMRVELIELQHCIEERKKFIAEGKCLLQQLEAELESARSTLSAETLPLIATRQTPRQVPAITYRGGGGGGGGAGGRRSGRRVNRKGSNGDGSDVCNGGEGDGDVTGGGDSCNGGDDSVGSDDDDCSDSNGDVGGDGDGGDGDASKADSAIADADACADVDANTGADAERARDWSEIIGLLQAKGRPFLVPLGCNAKRAREEYNKLVGHEHKLSARASVPCVGLLRAAGFNQREQHLAKMFAALLISAQARHLFVGATTDIIVFRTTGARSPAAVVTAAGLRQVFYTASQMSEDALRSLCRPRSGSCDTQQPPEPHWEKMNAMSTLGITHDFISGLPLMDTSDFTDPSSGLSKEEQDELKSRVSSVLHALAASLKAGSYVDPAPVVVELHNSLKRFREGFSRKRLRSYV